MPRRWAVPQLVLVKYQCQYMSYHGPSSERRMANNRVISVILNKGMQIFCETVSGNGMIESRSRNSEPKKQPWGSETRSYETEKVCWKPILGSGFEMKTAAAWKHRTVIWKNTLGPIPRVLVPALSGESPLLLGTRRSNGSVDSTYEARMYSYILLSFTKNG
jgi:hypothetical protein